VTRHDGLGDPDLVIIPGTRSTIDDLSWLRATGLAAAIDALRISSRPPTILGICGGYQMMGERIDDPDLVESPQRQASGLGWLPVRTTFAADKLTCLTTASTAVAATTSSSEAIAFGGYEIRHGRLDPTPSFSPWFVTPHTDEPISAGASSGAVLGTTLHGVFESDAFRSWFLAAVATRRARAWHPSRLSYSSAREEQIDRIADACQQHLDLDRIWRLIEAAALSPRAGRA
jgi:adenosylcobyric acid synthase